LAKKYDAVAGKPHGPHLLSALTAGTITCPYLKSKVKKLSFPPSFHLFSISPQSHLWFTVDGQLPHMERSRYHKQFDSPPSAPRPPIEGLKSSLEALCAILDRGTYNLVPPGYPRGEGLYTGPNSVYYLLFKLSELYPDLQINGSTCRDLFNTHFDTNQYKHLTGWGAIAGKWGISDDRTVFWFLKAISTEDSALAVRLARAMTIVTREPNPTNEWLYGRAGYLYLLRALAHHFPSDADVKTACQDATDVLVTQILSVPKHEFTFHGKAYLGAAHGIIGVITQVVLSAGARAGEFTGDVRRFLDLQREDGNWPSSLPPKESAPLVQFCHGAPGAVISLLSIRPYFPTLQSRIDDAIRKARECIYEKGILKKEPSLCHGLAGNVLALDKERAGHLMPYLEEEFVKSRLRMRWYKRTDAPESLYDGVAGRCWAWAVMDLQERGESGGMAGRFLGYNDV
jgi:hypothetical protein